MRIAKTLSIIFTVVAIMLLATSCSPTPFSSIDENHTIEQPVVTEEETTLKNRKSITISVDSTESNIEYFKYKFTPLFIEDNGRSIVGDTNGEWVTTSEFPTDWNIFLAQGKWNIKLEMYDSTNTKIGDTLDEDVYFSKTNSNLSNTFAEWLTSSGSGNLKFEDIITPKLYETATKHEMVANGDSIEFETYYVHWDLIKGDSVVFNGDFSLRETNGGLALFGDYTKTGIPVGSYTLSITIRENLTSSESRMSGGEIADVPIFRGCTTKVNASVDSSDYINCIFRAKQNETGYTGKIKAQYRSGQDNATLTLVAENATDVKWYQNGVYKPSYGNGTVANVSGIVSGAGGIGLLGTCSNYFDCVFTNSETGIISSCSYILVAGGSWGGSNTDGSIFTITTGNEVKAWNYTATAIDALGDSFGEGSGTTTSSAYFDERKWTIQADARNNNGDSLGNGTFIGYINKTTQFIDVPLSGNGEGKIKIGSIETSRNYDRGTYSNRVLYWKITNSDTGVVVVDESLTLSGNTGTPNWTYNPNKTYVLPNGTYEVELKTSLKQSGTLLANGTFTGHCTVIINVYKGVTTEVTGALTTDFKN